MGRNNGQRIPGELVGYLFLAAVVGLVLAGWRLAEGWTQKGIIVYGAAFLYLFGCGFLLAHYYSEESWVFQYLIDLARRGGRLKGWGLRRELYGKATPLQMSWVCFGLGTLLLLTALLFF